MSQPPKSSECTCNGKGATPTPLTLSDGSAVGVAGTKGVCERVHDVWCDRGSEVAAERQDRPPLRLTQFACRLELVRLEPRRRLETLCVLAPKRGTETNTLAHGAPRTRAGGAAPRY